MNLPKGFTLAEPPSGDGEYLLQAANFKAERTCPYRSEREQFCHKTLPWLISFSLDPTLD